jgi:hypothetical protein
MSSGFAGASEVRLLATTASSILHYLPNAALKDATDLSLANLLVICLE